MNLTTLPYPLDGESFMKYSLIHQYDGNTAIIGIKPHRIIFRPQEDFLELVTMYPVVFLIRGGPSQVI